ncbi:MAG: multifunctional CCA tRNA nucleotidyl transferase/2'3'-cyclic phosphodiesterase/2'nucleotidase/phosphatase [Pseudomonadales bacterium]|nr:multifunctional CCA tRNA nucleotidyl transferase/2'3'-cyclic phosphodiesterase/2'nucleotidase/phosphatase [Pseudomonadales bacterium]
MKLPFDCYLVGGAVRDELLGRPVVDRDWVVVGASVKAMRELGFQQVGRDFPVFLHPKTKEEFALARTERQSGQGHTGFAVYADPSVTLEDDLVRRDLTINAMAISAQGILVDPYDGAGDVELKTLRHVSQAFAEDPLRIFRVARFAAELKGFTVAQQTAAMMTMMCERGDLKSLSAERVWNELRKALNSACPRRFFEVLEACGGLNDWFPEVIVTPLQFDEHGNEYKNFVAFLGSVKRWESVCQRLKVPNAFRQRLGDWQRWREVVRAWQDTSPDRLSAAFVNLKVTHGPQRLNDLLAVIPEIENRTQLQELAAQFGKLTLGETHLTGKEFGEALDAKRILWLEQRGVGGPG